jgi:ATP-binding cassette subfamily F protein uup
MPLVTIENLSIGFRGPQLFDNVSATIDAGQRIGLLGRNGAGKTTLLRILVGDEQPDHGSITLAPRATIARLTQDVPRDLTGTIASVVLLGQAGCDDPETHWQVEQRVESTLSRMDLDKDKRFESLSSGMQRRVLLARAIAGDPDVLLLDEPTNHLDLPAIEWLEDFLQRWQKTLIFITHDRSFLQNLATRIWEIDRGRLFDWSCDYQTFLRRKQDALLAEEKQQALFDKKLAAEEVWIRQGIKARRTRNEGRVRALQAMRAKRSERRTNVGTAKLNFQSAQRSGALVADVQNISFRYGDQQIVDDFSTTLMRGDKVGIIGPNGAGKTTLLKLLLGQLAPDSGSVRLGTNLQIAYFDQLRDSLDPAKTLQENVGDGSDKIQIGDQTKHILGYLQDFLFTPERARTEVRFLSGGERNRALLARLMARPANVIVLDEPTNDLDTETLEMLEEQLAAFAGTLLMVSHDRTFLNQVVTSTMVFEADGVHEYVGGYDEWQQAVARRRAAESDRKSSATSTVAEKSKTETQQKRSYKEQRELEQLPQRIETIEATIASLHQAMAEATYFQQSPAIIAADAARLKQLDADLHAAYTRWEQLL